MFNAAEVFFFFRAGGPYFSLGTINTKILKEYGVGMKNFVYCRFDFCI